MNTNFNLLSKFLGTYTIATCKHQDVEPYSWLKDCLDKLPVYPVNRIAELLPIQIGGKGV